MARYNKIFPILSAVVLLTACGRPAAEKAYTPPGYAGETGSFSFDGIPIAPRLILWGGGLFAPHAVGFLTRDRAFDVAQHRE